MDKRTVELQDRLIDYAVRVIHAVGVLPDTVAGRHIAGQLLRSGTSPAPNYGEAVSSESRNDFVHKIQIALKELRESDVWLKIIYRAKMIDSPERLDPLIKETDELISILVASSRTARCNARSAADEPNR
jgi:four helix bundle protein